MLLSAREWSLWFLGRKKTMRTDYTRAQEEKHQIAQISVRLFRTSRVSANHAHIHVTQTAHPSRPRNAKSPAGDRASLRLHRQSDWREGRNGD